MTALETTDAAAFVAWMLDGVVAEGRGDHMQTLPVAPKGRLWLGRLAPEVVVQNSRLGERSERLEPCEAGVRLRLSEVDGRTVRCTGRLVVWSEFDGGDEPDAPKWRKSEPIEVTADLGTPRAVGPITSAGRDDFARALTAAGADGMVLRVPRRARDGQGRPRARRDAGEPLARGDPALGHQRVRGEPRRRCG